MSEQPKPTKAWYLVPIFFGIFGGIIMYFAVKPTEQKMANDGMLLGVAITTMPPLFYVGVLIGGLV